MNPRARAEDALGRFGDDARQAVYDAMALRRDIRHFTAENVDDEALERILGAAHLAPSVGFSQPWGFVIVRERPVRDRIRESFLRCREAEAARFPIDRREKYLAMRLEGIVDAALNVCVTVDLRPREEAILGTTVQPEAVRASAICAVQNLWLAARVEGVGVGWVSIVEPAVLRRDLGLPEGVEPVAYLCVGHARAFRTQPMLEELGWLPRRSLAHAIHRERWSDAAEGDPTSTRGTSDGPVVAAPPLASVREASLSPLALPSSPLVRADAAARRAATEHQALLTKPVGSLGRLETLGPWYAAARGVFPVPAPRNIALALFFGDHGVVAEGVSAYGSQITAAMACNVAAGGAAVNVLARRHGVRLIAVDVGIAGDTSALPIDPRVPILAARIRAGTRNLRVEPAMTRAEAEAALHVGARIATQMRDEGVDLAAVGEIGIGNTTAAAALVSAFTGASPEASCGRGTGIDDATRARKCAVVREALALHAPEPSSPLHALACLGGLEIAAMTGFLRRAAALRLPVVLDGFVTHAAALVARAIDPAVTDFLLASHASAEPGAALALAQLGLEPLLDLGLRLGEGTGALLALDLVGAAVAVQFEMSTFATAGIRRNHP